MDVSGFIKLLVLVVLFVSTTHGAMPCISRQFDQDSIVCVCNSTYCDSVLAVDRVVDTKHEIMYPYFQAYVTTKAGDRMEFHEGSIMPQTPNEYVYAIEGETNQTILGFGGAFTDAATMTINTLSEQSRRNLIDAYFGRNGIEYNMGRIPMASCDFSTRAYSYDDTPGDFNLSSFSLAMEDLQHKIPVIKQAVSLSAGGLSLFGSPWSCPFWMKTNNNMTGMGKLRGKPGDIYHKTWAQYFVKFLQAYKDEGVNIWGLTAQNEPSDGLLPFMPIPSLGWTPEQQRDFIAKDLGPALEAGGFGHVKLMILDDQRTYLPQWAEVVLADPEAAKHVSGIAVHWYADGDVSPLMLNETYEQFGGDYFILSTEACEQDEKERTKSVQLGNWQRGEHYFTDIVEDLTHGVAGWLDWNMALNMDGGPSWVHNYADSPIIVNAEKDEFYKQPMYYAMGHFSKFVKPGSKVLSYATEHYSENVDIQEIMFQRDDNSVAANFINLNATNTFGITIKDPMIPFGILNFDLPPSSMVTFTWFRGFQ